MSSEARIFVTTMNQEQSSYAIRKPLTSVEHVSEEVARTIAMERLRGEFLSVEDFVRRCDIPIDSAEALARSGAFDSLTKDSRQALWEIGVAYHRKETPTDEGEPSLFDLPLVEPDDIPELPQLSTNDRLAWDYKTHKAARLHPMALYRRILNDFEVRTIETCWRITPSKDLSNAPIITVGGIVVLRQAPSTAKGVMFVTLEDETGFIQTIVLPKVRQRFRNLLRAPALIVKGQLEGEAGWRGLLVAEVWELKNVSGGYRGFPSPTGGKDKWEIGS